MSSKTTKKILIIDDEISIRESFIAYFEDHDWNVLSAASSEEALEILKDQAPDCSIVDIRLPGLDGTGFIKEAIILRDKMVYVICTGSPEFKIPTDLIDDSRISSKLFLKPVTNLSEIEIELNKLYEINNIR